MNSIEIMKNGGNELNIDLSAEQIAQFMKYKDLLLSWNEKINLTAITEEKEICIKHFLDSLSCVSTPYIKDQMKIIDVGTGAGFPGIPIKIYYENVEMTLLDSLNKRITYLKEVCHSLDLKNVEFCHGRAEDYGLDKKYREQYDIAVARAVAELNILCEYCLPFVKVDGYFVCQKGPGVTEEIQRAKKAIEVLGGELVEKIDIKLPFSELNHNIIVIKKVKQTPTKYPRKAGTPTKKPL
ncbi:MAG: 16S rRNA (guanine(527)-N(7))-methyltransferase RsmG [Bacillota bacterium]